MSDFMDEKATAKWYVEAKQNLADPNWKPDGGPRWLVEDSVAEFEEYMNGPHPFLDVLSRRRVTGE